ncbi:MAG: N-acetylmuramoyl-L-alanine amidase [Syntrophomonadaceae bacterium]|nr:N-acetylmuramoyl-L-alanine amidase [Syntrophomonadaceae bacterium]
MQIQFTPSPNYRAGRKGRKIIAIVNHITAGLMPGTLSWLRNPQAQASAHYLVTKTGAVYQMVKDEDTAWHAGIVNKPNWPLYDGNNPNYYTLGIEHEALAGEALSEAQYQASLELHRQLVQEWGITVDQNHIIGHYRIDSINRKNDPGPGFPWDRLFNDLKNKPGLQALPIDILVANQLIKGVLIDNQSYAPVRALAESLGRQVKWDGILKTVFIPPVSVQVPAAVDGTVRIATGNIIISGQLLGNQAYAPVRKLAEALGRQVIWDEKTKTVSIK